MKDQVTRLPGRWLILGARAVCSGFVFDAVIAPAVADIRHERAEASNLRFARTIVVLNSYSRFWMAVVAFYSIQLATAMQHSVPRNTLGLGVLASFGMLLSRMGQALQPGWFAGDVGQLLGSVLALFSAVLFGARFAALIAAGVVAFGIAELAAHVMFGIHEVQGAVTHLTVLFAGMVAVGLGVAVHRYSIRFALRRSHRDEGE